ncbi:MAG: Crp/Fnr family transcriptional regulator [Halobacteriovoraceae bacterium]|nr:Crp/Fnr family transcriptional regulator [Halobacteriovoraceae bacterium]
MFFQLIEPHIKTKSEQTFKRNEIIYHEADSPKYLYFIVSGIVGLFHISQEGKETFFRVFGKGDMLGHRSYFAEEPYHASAVALTSVKVAVISTEECNRICEENPRLIKKVTSMMARDLGQAELRMAGLVDKTANKRIAESLVYLKLKHPEYVWTRKEIGEYSGSTFETVTRVMSLLEKNSLIEKQGRDFKILDPEKLLLFPDGDFA